MNYKLNQYQNPNYQQTSKFEKNNEKDKQIIILDDSETEI